MTNDMRSIIKEILRKALHAFSLTIWLVYVTYGFKVAFIYVSACLIVSFTLEVIRLRKYKYYPFKSITEKLARSPEKYRFAAHVHFFAGSTLTLYLLKNELGIIAILCSAASDAIAAIIGMFFGKHPNPWNENKTLEGTFAGMITAFLVVLFLSQNVCYGILVAIVFAIIDSLKIHINDNFILSPSFGCALRILELIGL
ncbi:MAG: hypothetical protein DRJ26_00715 [Candidatus Methanomethylicota archaeon]|uniref:Phosphatidate cytidylyltransferase n=1 Tax=Thermoproteota archaeon TaxID=2056631 RepID=A0A497F761_9CREN|nr:MAG: hypothetical protein DRJ26_00715 [Candidatus Verstraetearchaeota archaeon]